MPDSLTVNVAGRDITLDRAQDGSIVMDVGFPVGTVTIPADEAKSIRAWLDATDKAPT